VSEAVDRPWVWAYNRLKNSGDLENLKLQNQLAEMKNFAYSTGRAGA
jgi:hypothetical protein